MRDDTLNDDRTIGGPGAAEDSELPAGTRIGQYRIVGLLDRGGMGQVYEAEHEVLNRRFALKLLSGQVARRPDSLERFRREAWVMANLVHEHILLVDEFGEHKGRCFLRMPMVEGIELEPLGLEGRAVTLQDLADAGGGRVEQGLLADVLGQVLDALSYAHGQGVGLTECMPSTGYLLISALGDGRIAAALCI